MKWERKTYIWVCPHSLNCMDCPCVDQCWAWSATMSSTQHEGEGFRIGPAETAALMRSLLNADQSCRQIDTVHKGHTRHQIITPVIEVLIEHPGGSEVCVQTLVATLSRTGAGMATRAYLHQDTPMKLYLRTYDDEVVMAEGKVIWCEYHERGVHRTGVRFKSEIDPMDFADPDPDQSPVYSTLDESACPSAQIREYITVLYGCTKHLSVALDTDNYSTAVKLCRSLETSGAKYGFEGLSALAAEVLASLGRADTPGAVQSSGDGIRRMIRMIGRMGVRPVDDSQQDAA